MTNLPKSILLADDHSVVRQGISMILKDSYKDLNILHAADFDTAMALLKDNAVYLVVLDISIPEGKGVQMVELIKSINTEIKILIFSGYDEDLYAMRYLKAGAEGYLNKLSSETEFKKAFKAMMEESAYMSDAIKQKIINASLQKKSDNPLDILSNREIEIARLLVQGEGNLEIANRLNLQNSTVSTYKNRIFEKLSISNTVALVSLLQAYDDSFSA
jgi:DNA-binding NarL/FixJ family response regulator